MGMLYLFPDVLLRAKSSLFDILHICFEHQPCRGNDNQDTHLPALIVFDRQSELAQALTIAYQANLPHARYLDFDNTSPSDILQAFESLPPRALVVLIQSTHFRLDAYRLRVELFKRGLKVIEHPHLGRMRNEEVLRYIDALAYDENYYRGLGKKLKATIDAAPYASIESGGALLTISSPLEKAKMNIGDYRDMSNWGGQFPIGEVFTEAQDLQAVNGKINIFIFGDTQFRVNQPKQAITLVVEKGVVVATENSTPEFDEILAMITRDEGKVRLREIGFGMNRALTPHQIVSDIGTYERMCGIHLSLGAKHGVYAKPDIKRGEGKYHIDVFAVTQSVKLGEQEVFSEGAWVLS